MTAPQLPTQFALPSDGGKPMTYPQLLKQLSCICTAGAQIKPSSTPTATANLGDIIEIFGNNNDLKQNLLSWCKKNDSVIIREETLEQNVLRYLVLIK